MATFEILRPMENSSVIFNHPDDTALVLVTPEHIDIVEYSNKEALLISGQLNENAIPAEESLTLRRIVGVDKDDNIVFELPCEVPFTKEGAPLNTTMVNQYIADEAFRVGLIYHWGHEDLRGVKVNPNPNYDRLFVEITGEWTHDE